MRSTAILNRTSPLPTPLQVGVAGSFMERLRGLMFTRRVDPGGGLLLTQSRPSRMDASIHMLFVGYDLGLVWLDASRKVVDRCVARAWRPYYAPRIAAQFTLEIHPQRLAEFHTGDQIDFDMSND